MKNILKKFFHHRPTFEQLQNSKEVIEANMFTYEIWMMIVGGKGYDRIFLRQFLRVVHSETDGDLNSRRNFYNIAVIPVMKDPWFDNKAKFFALSDKAWLEMMRAVEAYATFDNQQKHPTAPDEG